MYLIIYTIENTTDTLSTLREHKLEEFVEKDMVWFESYTLHEYMVIGSTIIIEVNTFNTYNLINFIPEYHCFYYKF